MSEDEAVLESVETTASLVDISIPWEDGEEDAPPHTVYRVTVRFDLREGALRQFLMYFIRNGQMSVSLLRQEGEADSGSPLIK